jgi:hypothetical protein
MRGANLYIMKFTSIFTNMDRGFGKHLEKGLDNLRLAAEQ